MNELPAGCRQIQHYLRDNGLDCRVRVLAVSTKTAQEAANALGCALAQVVKSLVFRAKASDRPVLVLTCGDNRVSEKKVAALIGEKIGRADGDFVQARTGYAVGGVAPFAHRQPPLVLIDGAVHRFDRVWASAGTADSMFEIATGELIRLAGGQVADIAG
ncbi:MAG: YbaK/EbsC family protein [Proteobacteria bacterium]|nr:YbaK/EbsC family protein [Pseudomonadota bacterium]